MNETNRPEILRTEAQLKLAVANVAGVLSAVESGDLSARADVAFSESDPVGALAACINNMIGLLAARRDETLSFQRELEGQIDMIEKQRAAIRELSTPIIEIWPGVLCAPIVGVLDSGRAAEMTSALLNSVVSSKASLAIIDITGIEAMDTQATDHFLRMARAVKLLGSQCALSGIHPNVARTIVHMGIDLAGVESYRTLREALQRHVRAKARAGRAAPNKERGQGEPTRKEQA
jgi:rsbT co-antagonist protein RsbR